MGHATLLQSPEALAARWDELHRQIGLLVCRSVHAVADDVGDKRGATLDERLVQAIWSDQLVRSEELATASGKALRVIEPGRWNTGRGPDFLDARLVLAGQEVTGDVEIHVRSADWVRHGHHRDFEYNRVVLHVVLHASDDRPHEEQQNGGRLERLVLEPFLEPDLDTIRTSINPADYPHGRPESLGLCHEELMRLPREQLLEFLALAGRLRVEEKVARLVAQRRTVSPRQLFYQALMTAQGYKGSKTLYFLLARRAPIDELADLAGDVAPEDRADFVLAALLYTANLVPPVGEEEDDEARAYRERLAKLWRVARPYFSDRMIPPTRRWFAGVRPQGFPPRRLAAVATLAGRLADPAAPLMARLIGRLREFPIEEADARSLRDFRRDLLAELILPTAGRYFETHFTLGGRAQKPLALMGEPAAANLLFNVVLPLAIVEARREGDRRLEERVWRHVYTHPALEANSVVRMMENRLFGAEGAPKGLLAIELHQQALFRLFNSCCAGNERTCTDCTFLALASSTPSAQGH